MLRHLTFLLSAIFFCAVPLQAQVKKGFKQLDKKKYEKAAALFQRDLEHAEKGVAARLGLMKVAAAQKDFKVWLESFELYREALDAWSALDPKVQKDLKDDYGVSSRTLEQTFTGLCTKAVAYLEKSKTAEADLAAFSALVPAPPRQLNSRIAKIQQKYSPVEPAQPGREVPSVAKSPATPEDIKNTKTPALESDALKTKVKTAVRSQNQVVGVDRKSPPGAHFEFLKGINTAGSENFPILTADGKILYFTGSLREDNYRGEDIFYANRQADGSWGAPVLDEYLSGNSHESVMSISADGNLLLLYISGATYLTTRTENGWTEPEKLLLKKRFSRIGTAMLTRNGEALLLEAQEPAGSNTDLYIALREPEGAWGIPFKLDSTINTNQHERTPFLHSDFKTLYFSSSGHGGFGDLDVFKTTRLDDSWQKWSKPENLGPEINTAKEDFGFYIPPSGNVAYFSTELPGFSDHDIVRIPLSVAARPEAQVVVTGTIKDAGGKTMKGEITVEDAESQKVLQKVKSRPDGAYSFSIPKDAKINYYVSDGGISGKKTFVDASTYKGEVAEEKVEVVSAKEMAEGGKALELRDLLFDFAKTELRPEAQRELRRIYESIKDYQWKIEIGGHTDNIGSESVNQALSERRAQAVRDYLVELGLPAEKAAFKGYGSSAPVRPNDSDENRALNRRVEIRVQK